VLASISIKMYKTIDNL